MNLENIKEGKMDEIQEEYEDARAASYPIEISAEQVLMIDLSADTVENIAALDRDFLMYPDKQSFGHMVLRDTQGVPTSFEITRSLVMLLHDTSRDYGYYLKAKRKNLSVMIEFAPDEASVNGISW